MTKNKTNENTASSSAHDKLPVYDFCAARKLPHNGEAIPSNSVCDAVIHMLNVFFGGGILGIHVAFCSIGLTWAVMGLILLAALVGISMCSLTGSAQKMYSKLQVAKLSYPDLVENVALMSPWRRARKLSRFIRYFVELTLMSKHFGSCMVYQVFIAKTLKHLGDVTNKSGSGENIRFYLLAVSVPCLIIVLMRNMKFLTPFTVAIDLYISVLAMVIIYYGSRGNLELDLTPSINSPKGFFMFIGMSLFCLEAVSVSLPIENIMAYPKNFSYVVLGSVLYATYVMVLIGTFGICAFGDQSFAPITTHIPWTHFTIMIKVFSCITMYLSYAKAFYFGFDIQWRYIKKWHSISKWWLWERQYRILNIIVITLIACEIFDACLFMGCLGCLQGSLICFVFPMFVKLGVDDKHGGLAYCWRLLTFIVISTCSLVLIIAGIYYNINDRVFNV